MQVLQHIINPNKEQITNPSNTQVGEIIMRQEGDSAVITQAEDKHDNCQENNKVIDQERLTAIQIKQLIQLLKCKKKLVYRLQEIKCQHNKGFISLIKS